ncbi:alpha/beta hydrolase YcfP [Ferrimonas lipolytica]|uniref:Alpha/beta hydrolase n=1 Tax=Ferrimonas lipolytica TaxID=2724191 RepID=A0A6H1UA10_9GAMM|nr:alpha/beta hydrolase YcfP [Ferrimonas lipolytica]QIZ75887.1 alpha/beta hydrolase [Ferrimonas lipolytica]
MILYLHGFDATSPGNHQKVLQLKMIDDDVRMINYSTVHPRHDMQHLLNEVTKQLNYSDDKNPIIVGVGLGGYWAERIGFLCKLRSVQFNPNLWPHTNMVGKIDRPEEYEDIADKCAKDFRKLNQSRSLVILSRNDEVLDITEIAATLAPFYDVVWDEQQPHKFPKISAHLSRIDAFRNA